MIKQILYISIMVSIFVFIGYNVLTAEASSEKTTGKCTEISEPDDNFYCDDVDWSTYSPDRESVDEMCDASEDYAKNPKNCDKAYDLVEKSEKKECKQANGEWKKGKCTFYEDEQEQDQEPISKDPITNEDWRNTVTPSDGNLKIPSTTTKYYDDEDKEKQEEEIAEYNREADESHDGSEEAEIDDAEEADSSEENESEEEEDDGGDEEESDDSESSEE